MKNATIEVKRIQAAETRPLRHAVLRAGKPFETTIWPGDDAPETVHFGLYAGGIPQGVVSLYPHAPEQCVDGGEAWQLRGMAVLPECRGQGYGGQLMNACKAFLQARPNAFVWCNARASAAGFYEKSGFLRQGEAFDLPGIGPHYRMIFYP